MSTQLTHYIDLIDRQIEGRRWICTTPVAVPAIHLANWLMKRGARGCFVVASSLGTGATEVDHGVEMVLLGGEADDWMASLHAAETALQELPAEVLARIEAFDPTGEARVIGPLFAQAQTVAGRHLLGGRPWAWRRLEDKTIIDAVWDAAGVTRAPAEVVRVAEATSVHARLDQGRGTVWAADNKSGWYGGAARIRCVRTPAEAAEATAFFAPMADQVRVMPFLEGVPCSIHGIVFAKDIVTLRPMEMVVLRCPGSTRFQYAKAASLWDPAPADRQAMREAARRVGTWLRSEVGYRGAFTVDGVMTVDGFRPTELNPRFGAALGVMAQGIKGLDLYLLHLLIAEGLELDFRPDDLEALLLHAADEHRSASASAMVKRAPEETQTLALVRTEAGWRIAEEGETAEASATWGAAATGGIVLLKLTAEHLPKGPPAGPLVAAALMFLDAHWRLDIGPLEAAKDVRAR